MLLHLLGYVALVVAFVFVTLSLASGLLYLSELIEEHARSAKWIGQSITHVIVLLHVLFYFTEGLPLLQTLFSITCHVVYLQNFSRHWPLISLSSPSFIASCLMAIVNHFLWFIHFSRLARDARHARHPPLPAFTDIATFFGICVWLIPLFLFLSLSANDNALPTSSDIVHAQPSKSSSLFKSLFSLLSKNTSAGLIAPTSASALAYPLPPPHSPFLSPPPRSPNSPSQSDVHTASLDLSGPPISKASRRISTVARHSE